MWGSGCPGVHQDTDTTQGLLSQNWERAVLVLEDNGPGVGTEAPECLRLPSSLSQLGTARFLESLQYCLPARNPPLLPT